jgi:hypothetical protein
VAKYVYKVKGFDAIPFLEFKNLNFHITQILEDVNYDTIS